MSVFDPSTKSSCLIVFAATTAGADLMEKLALAGQPDAGCAEVVRINDALLDSLGMSRHDLKPLPRGWADTEAAAHARGQIRNLVRAQLAHRRAWLIRDPRMCLVAPLWTSMLKECDADAVAVLSSMSDVAAELAVTGVESSMAGELFEVCAGVARGEDEQAWERLVLFCGMGQATLQVLAVAGGDPTGAVGKSEIADLRRQVDALVTESNAASARLESGRRETDRITALQLTQARELAEIQASELWRAFVRARALLGIMPPDLRRQLRRALKVLWWAVTPWRLPARMRYLKERDAAQAPSIATGSFAIRYLPPSADATANDHGSPAMGTYTLTEGARVYTYIPPRKPADLEDQVAARKWRPRFSLVVPVYNTPPLLLNKLVDSVLQQWYPDWELILVNDNSSEAHVRKDLDSLSDPRIVVMHLAENKRIALATNEGIARATGDYIVFADHDDELTADCLYELAQCVEREDPDFIYSDEDKIDGEGRYVEPFFKPDWSPDTMMSTMFTCHVSCVRRELVVSLGGLRPEYDGSQDWDFILRVVEKTSRIAHIPKVLYHWRIIPASVASDLNAKPYAVTAGKRAREDALARRGLDGELEPVKELPGYFRTIYHLRGEPVVSIIIPSKNNHEILRQCIDSIQSKSSYAHYEIVVMDNGSTDPATVSYVSGLRGRNHIKVLSYDKPFNYSAINNLGAAQASGDLLLFLNDDTEVLVPDWLQRLGGYAQLKHVGAVGAKLLYPGGQRVQHVGVVNLASGPVHAFVGAEASHPCYFARAVLEYNWLAVTGACLMVERAKFDRVGGFDEALPVAYNDVDLCFRLSAAGFYNVVSPGVKLIHHESFSRGLDVMDPSKHARLRREVQVLYQKHPRFYQHDPFHNPNLGSRDAWFRWPQ